MSLKNPLGTSFISSLVIGFIWMVKWMVPNGFLFLFFLINSSLLASCKAKVNSSFLQKQNCALRKWYFLLHLSSQENYQQNATILKSFYFCILRIYVSSSKPQPNKIPLLWAFGKLSINFKLHLQRSKLLM